MHKLDTRGAGKKWPTVIFIPLAAVGLRQMLRGPAGAEQVFFILNRINDIQANFLEDYVESTVAI